MSDGWLSLTDIKKDVKLRRRLGITGSDVDGLENFFLGFAMAFMLFKSNHSEAYGYLSELCSENRVRMSEDHKYIEVHESTFPDVLVEVRKQSRMARRAVN